MIAAPDSPTPHEPLEAEAVIVGAGATGLLVADELARAGLRSAVLEAGPIPDLPTRGGPFAVYAAAARYEHPDWDRWKYEAEGLPCDWTRVRAAGGRTLLWGGWCERIEAATLRDAEAHGAPWPLTIAELAPYYALAERRYRVRTGRVRRELRAIERELGIRVAPKRGSVGPGGRRVGTALDLARGRRQVIPEAVALRVLCDAQGRAEGVEYVLADGRPRAARGRVVVLCASTVETIRLLLADPPAGIADRLPLVGRGLTDHLVASYLVVVPRRAARSSEDPLDRAALIPRFVNLGGEARDYAGGFTLEVTGPIAITDLGPERLRMLGMTEEMAREISFYAVHAMGEMRPHPDRYIDLHPEQRDAFGRPVPRIHLAFSEEDRNMARDMKEAALAVADVLAPAGSRIIPFRDPLGTGGLFHECGGCRMGADPRGSVTDPVGAVWGVPGLYVADAAVLPTAGDRHPTLTLLALAARTAHRIVRSR